MPICIQTKENWQLLLFAIVLLVITGCTQIPQSEQSIDHTPLATTLRLVQTPSIPTNPDIHSPVSNIPSNISFGYTFQQPDGNHMALGKGSLPFQIPIDIKLPGKPVWIVGTPYDNNVLWAVVLEDGKTVAYLSSEHGAVELDILPFNLPIGMPPLLASSADQYSLITVPDENRSLLTHPIYLPQSDLRVYITKNGDLKFIDPADRVIANLEVNALPDARIIRDERDRLLVLSNPIDIYEHGVLGDNLEAASLTLIETLPDPRIISVISLRENEVIEGISPIWVDMDGDKQREIVVTVSDLELGAGIMILSETGDRLAEGPKMGRAYRWRHQIGYLDLGPEGENELVIIRTPHIGGIVEYYRFTDRKLSIVAEYAGITSHNIGSRNLDMAILGDFDGDGVNELLLPNPDFTELVAVRRTPLGAEQAWRIDIGGEMSTNLSGVTLPNGKIALAVGRNDSLLTVWMP